MQNEQLRIREMRRYALEGLAVAEAFADRDEYSDAFGYLYGVIQVVANDCRIWLEGIAKDTGPIPEYGDAPMVWDS